MGKASSVAPPPPRPHVPGVLLGATLFAGAFGIVEAAVVVYLRHVLYHPEPFSFPLRELPSDLLWVESVREACTILMLWGLGHVACRRGMHRFAVFAYAFGLWDIVYYAGLWWFRGWPASLMDWDILFLIPEPWTSPVLAPVLVSLTLMASAVLLLRDENPSRWFRPLDWCIEGACGLVIIASFLRNVDAVEQGSQPSAYPWWLFALGLGAGLGWFLSRWRRRPRSA